MFRKHFFSEDYVWNFYYYRLGTNPEYISVKSVDYAKHLSLYMRDETEENK